MLVGSIALLWSCTDIPRDNLLDPKNADGYREPVVLIEAFVNSVHPAAYNKWALASLDKIKASFGEKVVLAEYHRDLDDYDDPYNTAESSQQFSNLQDNYVNADPVIPKGVPDIFVNGADHRVSGASSPESVTNQLTPILTDLLKEKNYYSIEPYAAFTASNTITATCKIARLGNSTVLNLNMRLILIKDYGEAYAHYVVLRSILPKVIGTLEKGKYKTIQFDPVQVSILPNAVIFVLGDASGVHILQSVREEL